MKKAGLVVLILGIAGLIYFGIQAVNNSESFSVLGADVTVSSANYTPLIISGVVTIVGLVLYLRK
ncbi:MAG: hypothetical protein WBA74_10050 [Cyclobacteriaceae bacterium]